MVNLALKGLKIGKNVNVISGKDYIIKEANHG